MVLCLFLSLQSIYKKAIRINPSSNSLNINLNKKSYLFIELILFFGLILSGSKAGFLALFLFICLLFFKWSFLSILLKNCYIFLCYIFKLYFK